MEIRVRKKRFRKKDVPLHSNCDKEMEILSQTSIQAMLFFVLYGVTGVVPLIAAFYLLLRRANASHQGLRRPCDCGDGRSCSLA